MALEGTNIRQNLQTLPSIFEIKAAETLDNLIYPALLQVFEHINICPKSKSFQTKYHIQESLWLCILWAIQSLYLFKRSATFGESFYGLQRVTLNGSILRKWQIFLSSVMVVLLPHFERNLKRKAENRIITRREECFLKALYVYKMGRGVHILLYLSKYIKSHNFLLKILGLDLQYQPVQLKSGKSSYILLKFLEIMVFFLQFLEWWYFSNNNKNKSVGYSLKNPKPLREDEKQRVHKGECPVCLMKIINPTACSISGYVYCWKCIMNHIRKHGTCPISGFSITLDDLIVICDSS